MYTDHYKEIFFNRHHDDEEITKEHRDAEKKRTDENTVTAIRKVLASVPCADEKCALYAGLHTRIYD